MTCRRSLSTSIVAFGGIVPHAGKGEDDRERERGARNEEDDRSPHRRILRSESAEQTAYGLSANCGKGRPGRLDRPLPTP